MFLFGDPQTTARAQDGAHIIAQVLKETVQILPNGALGATYVFCQVLVVRVHVHEPDMNPQSCENMQFFSVIVGRVNGCMLFFFKENNIY